MFPIFSLDPWHPSLKYKKPFILQQLENDQQKELEEQAADIENQLSSHNEDQKEAEREEKKNSVDEEKPVDLPDEAPQKKLVLKLNLNKTIEEPINSKDTKKLEKPEDPLESLLNCAAFKHFMKSSLFKNPNDEKALEVEVTKADAHRLPNNYKSRESTPEPG